MSDQKNYGQGVLLCLTATLSWGGMFPIMDVTLRHIDPFTFTCMRYAIAGLVFLGVLRARERKLTVPPLPRKRLALAWLFGTAGFAGFQFLVFFGQHLIGKQGALNASIMMATMPMMGALVTWVLKKVAPPRGALGFIALSFCGVILVITQGHLGRLFSDPGTYGADALLLFAALCWVIYTSGAGYFPDWSPIRYTTITTGLGLASAAVITAVLLAVGAEPVPTGGNVVTILPELAYMSLIAGFVGVLAWNIGNRKLGPLNGVLFMDVVPITAFTISVITGVVPSPMRFVGAGITALALVLNNIYLRRYAARKAAAAAATATPLTAQVPAQPGAGVPVATEKV
jgi:drug/metabolite transporter (DMT)-like permease